MNLQTLGEAIDEHMESNADSPESAALAMGVSVDDLVSWIGHEYLPRTEQVALVLRYLDIDAERYRGLCLRSQMRRVQTVIRYGPTTKSA
jgi:hypothetical protein